MSYSFVPRLRGLCLLLSIPLGSGVFAQSDPCGLEIQTDVGATLAAQQARGDYELSPDLLFRRSLRGSAAPDIVHLSVHVVRRSNGTGGISQSQLDQTVADANRMFAPVGIEFCVPAPIDYIDSNTYYSQISTQAQIDALRSTNRVPDTINCYFTETLTLTGFNLCGISSFTASLTQGVVMANACSGVPSNPSTFAHELGHYFDLYHTHEEFFGASCVDGSNCSFTGDFVCDTPADPRLSFSTVDTQCNYLGSETDPCNSDNYSPQTRNLMSYSQKYCRDLFTPEQQARMLATLHNLRPELIRTNCIRSVSVFCDPGVPNSSGLASTMRALGSGWTVDNDLTLVTENLPLNVFGYYLTGLDMDVPVVPLGSMGGLCVRGSLGRYNAFHEILFSGGTGEVSLALDLTMTPSAQGDVAVLAGETRNFQLWHRDVVAGSAISNFSEGLSVTFE
ncbi:MAG: M43 family zinc metalloprotease [Planctomycetota bacterium]|nr:M43 family zinc metalloprotease [Planctomycetota bacterium]